MLPFSGLLARNRNFDKKGKSVLFVLLSAGCGLGGYLQAQVIGPYPRREDHTDWYRMRVWLLH